MYIASLEAHTTLNTYNLQKLALDTSTMMPPNEGLNSEHFDHNNDEVVLSMRILSSRSLLY